MKLAIYIPDATYDQGGPENASEIFKRNLESEYKQKFEDVDIGAGAPWPAFQVLIDSVPILAGALVLFFSGERIEKNFGAWSRMVRKITEYFKHRPILDKNAAAILAVELLLTKPERPPKWIKLSGYRTTNTSDGDEWEDEDYSGVLPIDDIEEGEPDLQQLGGIIYWFNIESDAGRFQVCVKWDKPPQLKELPNREA